jgi:excisionase family DNA binding protein
MNSMESDHDILTMKDLCDLLHVHQSTVYKLVRKGKIPSFRIGTDWRRFVVASRQQPDAEHPALYAQCQSSISRGSVMACTLN